MAINRISVQNIFEFFCLLSCFNVIDDSFGNLTNATKTVALFISLNQRKPAIGPTLTFNNKTVYPLNTAKCLEILLDNDFYLKFHIISLEKKIARSIGVIAKVSYYLPNNALLTLYYSLVHTHLLYAISLWGSTYPTNLTN